MSKKILISLMLLISIISMIFNSVYATDENINNADLPSSYDLRNDIEINVENQGQRDWCAIYSATKVVQTTLAKTRNINYNLSESYLAYSFAEYFGGSFSELKSIEDINHSTGDVEMTFGMQVLESEIPNKDYEFNETNKTKFQNADIVIKSAEEANFSNTEEMKKHIITNGGIQVIIDGNQKWYNASNYAIYCNDFDLKGLKSSEYAQEYSHGVTIIGWDDNYSKDNFNSNCKPNNNGAWLILNSWGSNWGNNGTAWISYEDAWIYKQPIGVKNVKIIGDAPEAKLKYNKINNSSKVEAYITVNESVKDIEGWTSSNGNTLFKKTFSEIPDSYNIEITSQIDNSTTTVEVNIPKEAFERDYIQIGNNETNIIDIVIIIVIIAFIILIMVLIIIIFRNRKDKKSGK